MKTFITSTKTVLIAIVGIIGGCIWAYQSNWEAEPIILLTCSLLEVIAFIFIKSWDNESIPQPTVKAPDSAKEISEKSDHSSPLVNQTQNVSVSVNVPTPASVSPVNQAISSPELLVKDRGSIVELMKSKTKILFIDDDKKFNVVKILKANGWKDTKSFTDVKNIEALKDYQIFFVDINGVGKAMELEHEGLDLALMLKERFPEKKVVIYSANRNSNSFHKAWEKCDYKLPKNALPHQFTNLVEEIAVNNYKREL